MLSYLLHSSLLLAGLYLFYWLLLRKESYFQLHRWILLASVVLSLLLPLISIPATWSLWSNPTQTWQQKMTATIETFDDNQKNINAPEQVIASESENTTTNNPIANENENTPPISPSRFSISKIIAIVYWVGVAVFFLSFLVQLILLLVKMQVLPSLKDGTFKIVELNKDEAPYSFWTSIFINPTKYDSETYEQIIAHEKIHIKQAHYLDKLIAEATVIAFWFNPFAWFFRKTLSNNLEYLTDQTMLEEGTPKTQYQMSLLKVSVPQHALNLTTNYNQSFLKNRIAMMNAKKSSARSTWKYFTLLPLLIFAVLSLNAVKGPTYLETISDTKPTEINESTEPSSDPHCQKQSASDDDLMERFSGLSLSANENQTFQYWQWPKAQAALIQQLQEDGLISQTTKIKVVTCSDQMFVNGKEIKNPEAYRSLMAKYKVILMDGWRFKKDGQKIMLTSSVDDIELFSKKVTDKLLADGLISKPTAKNVVKIYGDDFYVNDQQIPSNKMASYHSLLDQHFITPAPGKVIIMNAKKTDFGVGYRADNTFAGTWMLGD